MKIFVLAVLLSLMQTPPPVPRQATDKGSASSRSIQPHGSTKQNSASPTLAVKDAETSPYSQVQTDKPHGSHEPVTVIVQQSTSGWEKVSVIFTGLLAAVGATGVAYAIKTLKALESQANIMQGQLIAMQRPKVVIKQVFLVPDEEMTGRPEDGQEWKIGCLIANVGGSKAEIIESDLTIPNIGITLLPSFLTPSRVPHYARKFSFGSFCIHPGERMEKFVVLEVNSEEFRRLRIAHQEAEKRARQGEPPLQTSPIICFGFFKYRDASGIVRVTGFGWEWNKRDMSFSRLSHPNYEYAD